MFVIHEIQLGDTVTKKVKGVLTTFTETKLVKNLCITDTKDMASMISDFLNYEYAKGKRRYTFEELPIKSMNGGWRQLIDGKGKSVGKF